MSFLRAFLRAIGR